MGPPTAMAATTAAASPGLPCPQNKVLLKGDSEKTGEKLEEEDNEEPDKTLLERLWGLMERIPSRAGTTFDLSLFVAQTLFRFFGAPGGLGQPPSRSCSFLLSLRLEVADGAAATLQQQQQMLLRPNTGLSGGLQGLYFHSLERSRLLLLYLTCLGRKNLKIQ